MLNDRVCQCAESTLHASAPIEQRSSGAAPAVSVECSSIQTVFGLEVRRLTERGNYYIALLAFGRFGYVLSQCVKVWRFFGPAGKRVLPSPYGRGDIGFRSIGVHDHRRIEVGHNSMRRRDGRLNGAGFTSSCTVSSSWVSGFAVKVS